MYRYRYRFSLYIREFVLIDLLISIYASKMQHVIHITVELG